MTSFDRDNNNMRPGYGYFDTATGNAPAWIIGIVVVALIIGVLAYSGHHPGAPSSTNPSVTHEMTQPPPVNPALPPQSPKP
jgi:hypothetical protein